jgi:hypothetical protein
MAIDAGDIVPGVACPGAGRDCATAMASVQVADPSDVRARPCWTRGRRPRQGPRNPAVAPPARGVAAPTRRAARPVRASRSGVAGRAATPAATPDAARLRLLVRLDTILKWHRDLIARRHDAGSRPRRRGRPRTLRSIRALVLRLARENGSWGSQSARRTAHTWDPRRPVHRLGDPARGWHRPGRAVTTWTDFLRSQADALLAADFVETVTLTGARMYILTVIEHASRRIRVLGVTAHPTAAWVSRAARPFVREPYRPSQRRRTMHREHQRTQGSHQQAMCHEKMTFEANCAAMKPAPNLRRRVRRHPNCNL